MGEKTFTFLYAGDEIEVSSPSLSYESVKTLNCLSHPEITRPVALLIAVSLRTHNSHKQAWAGIFIDDCPLPNAEVDTNSQSFQTHKLRIPTEQWAQPRLHTVELRLKTEPENIAYNNYFELYYVLRES